MIIKSIIYDDNKKYGREVPAAAMIKKVLYRRPISCHDYKKYGKEGPSAVMIIKRMVEKAQK